MSIAPNPVRDMMQVTVTTTRNDLMDLCIFDLSGKVVRRIKTDLQPGVNVISVDNLSTMQRGMYVVVASIGEQKLREKIVLSK
jgi:hypothetical protein